MSGRSKTSTDLMVLERQTGMVKEKKLKIKVFPDIKRREKREMTLTERHAFGSLRPLLKRFQLHIFLDLTQIMVSTFNKI